MRISLDDARHAAFIHASNCMIVHTDLVHMVEIFKIWLWYVMEIEEKELDEKRWESGAILIKN